MVEDMGNLSRAISAGAEKPSCLPDCFVDDVSSPNHWVIHAEGCPNIKLCSPTPLDHVADAQRYGRPPRQSLWQNLRAALAYILLAWALDVMPDPVSTILSRGMEEALDAYEPQVAGWNWAKTHLPVPVANSRKSAGPSSMAT